VSCLHFAHWSHLPIHAHRESLDGYVSTVEEMMMSLSQCLASDVVHLCVESDESHLSCFRLAPLSLDVRERFCVTVKNYLRLSRMLRLRLINFNSMNTLFALCAQKIS
jgi:hypothetical protein